MVQSDTGQVVSGFRYSRKGVIVQFVEAEGVDQLGLVYIPHKLDGIDIKMERVGKRAFRGVGVEEVIICKGVREIGKECFAGCKRLKKISLPCTLELIEDDAFAGCDKLVELYIPDSVRSIGFGAFAYCNSLRNVSLPEGVSISGKGVFAKCGLKGDLIERRRRL